MQALDDGVPDTLEWTIHADPDVNMLVKPAHVPWFTDTCCVNRIPDVIQAPSGLVDITRLGPPKYVSSLKGDLFAEKHM